jgi:LPS sulfotransferase NodH
MQTNESQTLEPGTELKPFVIISYLRSGTHLLRTALESHSNIVCQTEVFNSDNPRLPYSLETPTEQILQNWVYNQATSQTSHIGFVLQAYHPFDLKAFPGIKANPEWANIWDILAATDNLKVIYLHRDNLLKRHLSHRKARKTGQWHNWKGEQLSNISLLEEPPQAHVNREPVSTKLSLDAINLEHDFQEVLGWQKFAKNKLRNKSHITLLYEDLCNDLAGQCAKVQDFLGVPQQSLSTGVSKLDSSKLSDSIVNYHTLKKHFADSEWARFFDE